MSPFPSLCSCVVYTHSSSWPLNPWWWCSRSSLLSGLEGRRRRRWRLGSSSEVLRSFSSSRRSVSFRVRKSSKTVDSYRRNLVLRRTLFWTRGRVENSGRALGRRANERKRNETYEGRMDALWKRLTGDKSISKEEMREKVRKYSRHRPPSYILLKSRQWNRTVNREIRTIDRSIQSDNNQKQTSVQSHQLV